MIIGFNFTDDNNVPWAGKLVFNPGGSTFTVYYHENFDAGDDVRTDGYWSRIEAVFELKDRWYARDHLGLAFRDWMVQVIFEVPLAGPIDYWDDPDDLVPIPAGWVRRPGNYNAFIAFLAQPRIVDPCKGWSSEELQGPYTNAVDLADLIVDVDDSTIDNLRVRPRAILRQDAVAGQFLMNSAAAATGSTFTVSVDVPIGTILPIRPIGFVGTPTAGEWTALW